MLFFMAFLFFVDEKVLVVYFSGTGTTKGVAKKIKKATGGKIYQIKAADRYTSADLDYSNDNCRANVEQRNGSVRPKIKGRIKNIRKYDVIFVGYPIWWNKEPKVVKGRDLTGRSYKSIAKWAKKKMK